MDVPEKNLRLECRFGGWILSNPFLLGAGPATRSVSLIHRAFSAGWAAAVTPPVSPVRAYAPPRYASVNGGGRRLGLWRRKLFYEGDRDSWRSDVTELKRCWPERLIIASVPWREAFDPAADFEAVRDSAADAVELDMTDSPDCVALRRFVGQLGDCCDKAWVARFPHDTPELSACAREVQTLGGKAVMIRGILSGCAGVNLTTLRLLPDLSGIDSFDGEISGSFLKPALIRLVAELHRSLSIPVVPSGVVAAWNDAAELFAAGASAAECDTMAIMQGYGSIDDLRRNLSNYLGKRSMAELGELVGAALRTAPGKNPGDRAPHILNSCTGCGRCVNVCADGGAEAIRRRHYRAEVDPGRCIGCGLCRIVCTGGHLQ